MSIRLNGSTSGYTELDAQASPGNNTLKFPASNGAARQAMRNGTTPGTMEFADDLVLMTAQNTTSGTSIDFTDIPSWVKRVTVMFSGVSTNGTSFVHVQLGTSAGFATTGYGSHSSFISSAPSYGAVNSSAGFLLYAASATSIRSGTMTLHALGNNKWVSSHIIGCDDGGIAVTLTGGGNKDLSSTLDRIRITTVNGTDTFDAGTINVMYE